MSKEGATIRTRVGLAPVMERGVSAFAACACFSL
jgi:hypothetical protein